MKDKKNYSIGSSLGVKSNSHWQVNANLRGSEANNAEGAFNPKSPKDRPKTYPKTNECDY